MFRLVLLATCLASIAFAQVVVTGKNGKTVKIGTGATGVDVQSGNKQVKVKTGTTAVKVEGSTAADEDAEVTAKTEGNSATVNLASGAVAVENAGPAPVEKEQASRHRPVRKRAMNGARTPASVWGLVLETARRCVEPGASARSVAVWLGATDEPIGNGHHFLIEAPRHPALFNASVLTEADDARPNDVTLQFPVLTAPRLSDLGPATGWRPSARMSWQLPFHHQPGPAGTDATTLLFAHPVTDDADAPNPRIRELVIRVDRP